MKYCSECGQALIRRWVAAEQRDRSFCEVCGITHYENPRVIVCCIVCWRDKLLLCRRAHEPGQNKWMVPGGYLECGETLEGGAARETFEETGLAVDPNDLRLYSIVNMNSISQIMISFRIQLEELPQLRPGPECLDVAFMSESEIQGVDFAWRASMGDGLARFFTELRTGEFSIQLITLASDEGTRFKWHDYQIR